MTISPIIRPDDDADATGSFVAVVLEPIPEDAPEWARIMHENMAALATGINQTNAAIGNILDIADGVKDQVNPLIEQITASPMLGMLIGKGKR